MLMDKSDLDRMVVTSKEIGFGPMDCGLETDSKTKPSGRFVEILPTFLVSTVKVVFCELARTT
jgi:hypothetical protein